MSMWEPRSSHLYVWTGLRVCEWLRVGAGTLCLCCCCGQSGARCARWWCVQVCSVPMVCGCAPLFLRHVLVSVSKYVALRAVCSSVWPKWACVGMGVAVTQAVLYSHAWASVQVCVGTRECPLPHSQLCTRRHV